MNVDGDDVVLELVSEMANEKRYVFVFNLCSVRRAKVTATLSIFSRRTCVRGCVHSKLHISIAIYAK